jgi:hypothetical protein
MSREALLWFIFTVVAAAECIRQFWLLRKALAVPDEWADIISNRNEPKEGGHASDRESL